MQDVNHLVSDIISRQVLGREVERILQEEKRSLSVRLAPLFPAVSRLQNHIDMIG
jgi:phosphoenolpyruvate carboxylase